MMWLGNRLIATIKYLPGVYAYSWCDENGSNEEDEKLGYSATNKISFLITAVKLVIH